jgi:hypothetical protein
MNETSLQKEGRKEEDDTHKFPSHGKMLKEVGMR